MLVLVASAQSEPEAQMICTRLSEAGIPALSKRGPGTDTPQFGVGGSREVYVEEALSARALELLQVPEFTDEELAELSERAGRDIEAG
jgi:hypothetical protein